MKQQSGNCPVGIIGGMGPAAGVDFENQFVTACSEVLLQVRGEFCDQDFPEHWLAQVPIPDRTSALLGDQEDREAVLRSLLSVVRRMSALGIRHVALACNTAHSWHSSIQSQFPHMEILDVAGEVRNVLMKHAGQRVGLLATKGTYQTGIYATGFESRGLRLLLPTDSEQDLLMSGIYDGVKAGKLELARSSFESVATSMALRESLDALVLGCTEIPIALKVSPVPSVKLIDAGKVLACALALRALNRKHAPFHPSTF